MVQHLSEEVLGSVELPGPQADLGVSLGWPIGASIGTKRGVVQDQKLLEEAHGFGETVHQPVGPGQLVHETERRGVRGAEVGSLPLQ
jgi:hypothetical protein